MRIGLDAGHGLKTSGKQTPDGIKEWELNDKVRDRIVEILKDYDCEIINTDNDEGNVDEGLTTRRTMYVNVNVDAFVSIHHNAFTGNWNDATGVEIYTDRNYTEQDERLANAIYKNLPTYTGLKGRGIKRANLTVINQSQIPAVLVEGGFMDSNNDYKVITSEEGQNAYARAVAEGLIEFLGLTKLEQPIQNNVVNYTVKITTDVLNVRQGPGTGYQITTKVREGEIYTIVEENNGWGKLKSGAGWISLKYTDKQVGEKYSPGSYEVTANVLNVREKPTTDSRIVTTLLRGSRQGIDKTDDVWGHILNNAGWICLDYCKKI